MVVRNELSLFKVARGRVEDLVAMSCDITSLRVNIIDEASSCCQRFVNTTQDSTKRQKTSRLYIISGSIYPTYLLECQQQGNRQPSRRLVSGVNAAKLKLEQAVLRGWTRSPA